MTDNLFRMLFTVIRPTEELFRGCARFRRLNAFCLTGSLLAGSSSVDVCGLTTASSLVFGRSTF